MLNCVFTFLRFVAEIVVLLLQSEFEVLVVTAGRKRWPSSNRTSSCAFLECVLEPR